MSEQPQAMTLLSPEQQRQIALRDHIGQGNPNAIAPRTLGEVEAFAKTIAHSSLIPSSLREKAPDVMVMLLAGAELGIPPMASLRSFHVIEGVPRLSSDGLASIVSNSPLCEYLEPAEMSSTKVVWRTKRVGRPEVVSAWTIEDANKAGISGGKNWQKYPRAMLNARCKAELCRLVYPEIAAGLQTVEEIDEGGSIASGAVFSAPPPPPAPANDAQLTAPDKPNGKGKSKTKTDAVIDVPSTETKSADDAKTDAQRASNAFDQAATAARQLDADRAKRAAEAKAAQQEIPSQAAPAATDAQASSSTESAATSANAGADDGGFGDEPETPEQAFKRFGDDLGAATKDTLDAVKTAWLPWSKQGQPGHQFAPRMREMFAKRRADLGL